MGVRAIYGALLWLFAFIYLGECEAKLGSRALTVNDFPSCGLTCLLLTVPASGCSLSDVSCQCSHEDLGRASAACLLANCTMAETLDTAKVQADLCGLPEESKADKMYLSTIVAFSIATLFVTLRFIGKLASKRIAMDDWVLVAALIVTVPPGACVIKMAGNGFGEHLWNLEHGQLLQNIRLFYIASSIYTVALGLIKVSLCMFYLEIFPAPRVRLICYMILSWIVINTLVIFFLTIFSCIPIEVFWNRDANGRCLDINALAYANSASAIAQDIVLVLFPLSCIRNLNMKRYRKFAVGFMFCIGTFGCVTTMIRLHTLLSFGNSIDPTWDYVPAIIWTELELACCFICASLPAVRILFIMLIPESLRTAVTSRSKSRSRSTPTPGLGSSSTPKSGRRRLSWMHIATVDHNPTAHLESQRRKSRFWPSTPSSYSPRLNNHRRLSSGQGHYEDVNLSDVGTFTPSSHGLGAEEMDQVLGLPTMAASRRTVNCHSCGLDDEMISALPRIGCLPDESFHKDDRGVRGTRRRWWEEIRRSIDRPRRESVGKKGEGNA